MKFDITKILIIFLLLSTIGFGLSWYFRGLDESKQKVKELEEKYKVLEREKLEADAKIATWKEVYKQKDVEDKKIAIEVVKAKNEALVAKQNADKAKLELSKIKGDITKTRKEIEELKKNPKVLSDDELLEDLIKNTK
jgi:ABC-type Na+ efflux pump permease subunit